MYPICIIYISIRVRVDFAELAVGPIATMYYLALTFHARVHECACELGGRYLFVITTLRTFLFSGMRHTTVSEYHQIASDPLLSSH